MTKEKFLARYDKLRLDEKKNYKQIDALFLNTIESEGIDFFIKNKILSRLARCEKTIYLYCQTCEKNLDSLSRVEIMALFYSYLHLSKVKKARAILTLLDLSNTSTYDEVLSGLACGKFVKKRHNPFIIKYDLTIKEKIFYLIEGIDSIIDFIKTGYDNFLLRHIYLTILNGDRYAFIGPFIKEIFINTAIYEINEYNRKVFQHCLVHEYTHLYQNQYYTWGLLKEKKEGSVWRFVNEMFADFKAYKFLGVLDRYAVQSNYCAYHLINSKTFTIDDILYRFTECTKSTKKKLISYRFLVSFCMFLIDKYGYDRINKLPAASRDYDHGHSFLKYLILYFGCDIEILLRQWKKNILTDHKPTPSQCTDDIVDCFKVEGVDDKSIILSYSAKYYLSVWDNIITYSGERLIERDEVTKHKYLKEGKFKIDKQNLKFGELDVFIHFYQYSQYYKIDLVKYI